MWPWQAWSKSFLLAITEQLRLEKIYGGHLVPPPLLKQGQAVHSTQVICKLNNPITYCE